LSDTRFELTRFHDADWPPLRFKTLYAGGVPLIASTWPAR
jgi:hypothetical protein